jgi:TolB-like protein/DNA-binding winged helix-turn-helix (wHTH) protein/Tfp pilus assembly protein PilF
MNLQAGRLYTFGSFRLDPRERLLFCSGKPVPLSPKAFELLLLLVTNAGHLIEKDDLIRQLWPDTFVEEGSLVKHVYLLRKALAQGENGTEYIETVPKIGYRFLAKVIDGLGTVPAADLSASRRPVHRAITSSRRRAMLLSVGLVLLAAFVLAQSRGWIHWSLRKTQLSIRSIAVLPLENVSGDPTQEYFADGMTDQLITDLGKIGELRVVSRTSAMQYKGVRKSLPQIGRELNVDAVIEGSVQRSGSRVRITAQLVQASTDKHLWAEKYDGDIRDVLQLQDEVASAIVDQIRIKLTPQERALLSSSQVVDPQAHEAYLKGLYLWNERSPEGLQKAIEYFNQAIRKDPDYALAYAGLADVYGVLSDHDVLPPGEAYPKAKAAVLKALAIDDTLGEAHTCLAWIEEGYDWDAQRAEKEFQRAIQLNPNYATAHYRYSRLLYDQGRLDESVREAQRAVELDPIGVATTSNLGDVYYYARRYNEAIQQHRKAAGLHPGASEPHQGLFLDYLAEGMYAGSIAEAQRWLIVSVSGEKSSADAAAAIRRIDSAGYREALRVLISQAIAQRKVAYASAAWIAILCARRGDEDKALDWLEQAYGDRDDTLPSMKVEPAFDMLRSNPRFQEVLRRVGSTT